MGHFHQTKAYFFLRIMRKGKRIKKKTMRNTKTKQAKPVFTEQEICMLLLTRPREENQWRLNCIVFPKNENN